jgi:AcrR family transcriptional regulator
LDITAPTEDQQARRGRPRDPEVDEAIMVATIDLLEREGFARLTMEGVAERAGVGKASLSRRWPNKVALVVEVVRRLAQPQVDLPDTGNLHDDMLAYVRIIVRSRRAKADILGAVGNELVSHPELAQAFRTEILAVLRSKFTILLQRGIDRGELPASTDVELLADLAPALLHHRHLSTGEPMDERLMRRIVDQFFPKAPRSRRHA